MPDEITDRTTERIGHLIGEYAHLCGRSLAEVAYALVKSKTLRRHGYSHAQRGHLTETQGQAAIRVLEFWIRSKNEQHQQG